MNPKRQRTENWSKGEIVALKASYLSKYDVIEGRLSSSLTNRDKENAWSEICENVNCQDSRQKRTLAQIKKKISDIKVCLRRKERVYRESVTKTGGGPPPTPPILDEYDSEILKCIPQSSISGFNGYDTFAEKVEHQQTVFSIQQKIQSEETQLVEDKPIINTSDQSKTKSMKRKYCTDTETKQDYISIEKEKLIVMKEIMKSVQVQAANTEKLIVELKNLSGILLGRDILNTFQTEW